MQKPDLEAAARSLCNQRQLEFVKPLGRGAFKSAYLAKTNAGLPLALKLALISGPFDRMLRETEALRACEHVAIAKLLDAFAYPFQNSMLWVVVEEFLPGGTLETRQELGVISPSDVRALGIRLADALAHLHPRKLVHRDIKPANIMFRSDGNAVLTDFGIVRVLDAPSLTKEFLQQGPGTPAYAAPEQLTNEKALIDWRTDQFGLAVVLAECLLGRHPYMSGNKSLHEAIYLVASKQTLPDETVNELISAGFKCLLQALAPWPTSRYRRPAQFIEALNQY